MSWWKKLLGLEPENTVQPVSINDSNYKQEVLKSDLPVLLDLWSPTCVPCKQLIPIIIDLARKYDGKVKVCECDISASPAVARHFKVRATPTVLYIKNGKIIERVVGFRGSLYHTEIIETEFLGNTEWTP